MQFPNARRTMRNMAERFNGHRIIIDRINVDSRDYLFDGDAATIDKSMGIVALGVRASFNIGINSDGTTYLL